LGVNDLNTWVRFKSLDKDGSKIAFVIDPIPQFGTPDKSSIAILDTMTGNITTILDTHSQSDISDITDVAIAPDAKTILFAAKTNGKSQIFQINTDATELRQIIKGDLEVRSPTWGPDGKHFYASVYNPNTLEVQLNLYALSGEIINTMVLKDIQLWGWFRQ
jgi:Tol biopolymer transport system component